MASLDLSAQSDALDPIFAGLKSRNAETRAQSAEDLGKHVQILVRELSSDAVQKLWEANISKRLVHLVNAQSSTEKHGGLLAIDRLTCLEEDEGLDPKRNLPRFYNYVKTVFPNTDASIMEFAAKILGKIVKGGGSQFGEAFMEYEVPGSIQLLQSDKPDGRYAGILVLKELALCNATNFYPHAPLVLEKLLTPLRDPRPQIREAAADLLATCLDILQIRDKQSVNPVLTKILQEGHAGLKSQSNTVEVVHGSLLACRELFKHAGMFMKDSYFDTAEMILRHRNHRDPLIRKTVVSLIPVLADYDNQKFADHFLHRAMGHLLEQLMKPTERSSAFIAIGEVSKSVGSEIKKFLEPVMEQIKSGLQQRGKKNATSEEPMFECLALLASAVGPNLTKLLHDVLDLIFDGQLTENLVTALVAIARNIPPLLRTIQIRLLDLISIILSGQIYKPLGAPPQYARPDIKESASQSHYTKSPEQIRLALDTLGSFDFSGHVLNEFVRNCALPYLEDDNPEIRKTAALTSCRLFVRDPICHQVSNHSIEIISDVLDKLLTVGIADLDPEIRRKVLEALDERFDKHLSQSENVRSIFIAMNDEVFENRKVAVKLIGRLALHNPAYVMPSLRKALIQMMTELQFATAIHTREECSQLLKLVIQNTQRLIKPYAVAMIVPLLDRANGPNPTVAANIMDCIGELSVVAAEDALSYVPGLMKIILAQLVEPIPIKRDAALRALGQVCSSTGYVIQPLVDYPELLPILHRIMKSESSSTVRREVLRVLGILGAIDPYRRRSIQEEETAADVSALAATPPLPISPSSSSSSDEYFQTVVINALLEILKDQSLNHVHHVVIESVMNIFKTQGLKCVSFLPQIIPAFTQGTRTARYQEYYLSSLATLVGIIKEHVRNYVHEIFLLIMSLWDNVSVQQHLILLIEALGKALDAEFKPYLGEILPPMLRIFDGETSEKKSNAQMKVFDAFLTFGSNVEEYLHLIIPVIVKAYEREGTIAVRRRAVQTIEGLTRRVNVSDHASRIIHPLIRTLSTTPNTELRLAVMETLCALVLQLGRDFAIFIPTINKVLYQNKISNAKYEGLITKLLNGERLSQDNSVTDSLRFDTAGALELSAPAESTKLAVNQQHLKQAWDVSQALTEDDWNRWLNRFAQELIKQSPSHALRACMSVVFEHGALALTLFNAAFLSCWTELYDQYQEDLVKSIEYAIASETISKELAHKLLNLTEFMEHDDKKLLIEDKALEQYAMNVRVFAKALHYKELEFFAETSPSTTLIEELIQINTNLQQSDAAFGILTVAKEQYDVSKHEEWYERLHRWKDALAVYEKRTRADPHNPEVIMGTIRCLHALGEWARLARCVEDYWAKATDFERREMAGMGAAATWSLSEWDSMDDYIAAMSIDAPERSFFKAILAVHKSHFKRAEKDIARARDFLIPELTADVGESYTRTYNVMIRAQMLSELEEIIQYKQYADQPERQESMKRMWMKRLQGCQPEVEHWQRILQVRSLVLRPGEDGSMWIKFANLCRKADRMVLAEKAINSLLESPYIQNTQAPPSVVYAQLKFMWAQSAEVEERNKALTYLRTFTSELASDFQVESNAIGKEKREEMGRLLARCYFKQGQWQEALQGQWSLDAARAIISSYQLATQYDKAWYKAWHTWALVNFEVVEHVENHERVEEKKILPVHVRQAIDGFFWSISLHNENSLQDTLRLLTLWFKFGSYDEISSAMADGFSKVDVDTWLDVIPQIIARIQTPNAHIRQNIDSLLNEVGKHHPQALVYPLTVASKSSSQSRKNAALSIMDRMRDHSVAIVEQALLVSQELIRVAILWHELWHEGLEEASRLYYTDKNPEGMIAVLERLHDMLEEGPKTIRETTFAQVFGRDLREAREYCRRYRTYGDEKELDKAWDIYYSVFKKVEKQMPQLTTLDLQYVSPELLRARNLELAVPGTYASGKQVVYIKSFASKLSVISSKQRPRRLTIKGDNGVDYNYLLKGHEDLRQDERVMQLFSLVNTLLSIDVASFKRRLHIQRYPVIPIAPNVGLIGWVKDSDTLHVLVRDYRESRKILLNIEYRLMLQMAPDYENLTLLQKVEVFEYALDNTTGQDLYRVLWLKSASSEHWLERRATYTRSLAVNSMVGHILGLGDRHPSNVLLERSTGKVVHIDFGDCFEVAMLREKFPEKIPFRLTRMLTHAMEVSGIQGSFKNTCEISMRVLRDNKESLMAVLEAFVYDPLINWRLLQVEIDNRARITDSDHPEQFARKAAGNPQGPNRKLKTNENDIFDERPVNPGAPGGMKQEVRNERAIAVINRVKQKLTGHDFNPEVELKVDQQVEKLIQAATSLENLCQCFSGWCAFW